MLWTDKMVEDLMIMWEQGITAGEIGKRLGVSKNSIVGKVHRLQLDARPSPIRKKDGEENDLFALETQSDKATAPEPKKTRKTKEVSAKPTENESKKNLLPKEKTEHEEKPVKKELPIKTPEPRKAVAEDVIKRIERSSATARAKMPKKDGLTHLMDLDNHTCRWPIDDPKDENFHFCGRKIRMGQTYCEEHAAMAYVKPTPKK